MIYLDNAATTYPKPRAVITAVDQSFARYGANPGRSDHALAIASSEQIYKCREILCDFFGADSPEQVCFTVNCTAAVNTLFKGLLKSGDHVVISSLEHNAVRRPLQKLMNLGVDVSVVRVDEHDPLNCVGGFEKAIRGNTRLIFCMHASNVLGVQLPCAEIGAMARRHGIPFGVDTAQSAGYIPVNMKEMNIDYLCVSGHKGLYGPMGTGALIVRGDCPDSLAEGGTGSASVSPYMPDILPDRLESGTVNTPGICGLYAGVKWVMSVGLNNIMRHDMDIVRYIYANLAKIPNIVLYTDEPNIVTHVPLLSFNFDSCDSQRAAAFYNDSGIAVRAGLHCTPMAHNQIGTLQSGTVRICPSYFTTSREAEMFVNKTRIISKKI